MVTGTEKQQHLETLAEIRSLMERSSRFISLSGLSGVAAGIWALLGALAVYLYLEMPLFSVKPVYYAEAMQQERWGISFPLFLLLDASVVLILALGSGVYFTTRRARRQGQKVWDPAVRKLLVNLAMPLLAGGVFCLALYTHGQFSLVAPTTLVFYGLALLNGGKYTLSDVRYLGMAEIALGLLGLFYPGYGLELWAVGFGILHILYGAAMYYKYDLNSAQ